MEINLSSHFQKLKTAILLSILEQETKEPQYYAIGFMSEEGERLSKISEYANDIDRIMRELKMALSFIITLPEENFVQSYHTTLEDYILYHQGYSLDLIHQIKDKTLHLIDGLTTQGKYVERRKLSIASISKKVSNIEGLSEELGKWNQESQGGIGVALRRRKQYHHFRNRLTLHEKLMDVKLQRTFEQDHLRILLSEYGRGVIANRGKEGMAEWHKEVVHKLEDTITLIEESVENISRTLIKNLNLPTMEEKSADIFKRHGKMLDSLSIRNECARDKISPIFSPHITTMEMMLPTMLEDQLACLYVTGSVPRGEAAFRVSDINFVLVLDTDDNEKVHFIKDSLDMAFSGDDAPIPIEVDIYVTTKTDFMSADSKKIRFICKTDGLLLIGENLLKDEKFPKPGLQLAGLLNSDVRSKVQCIKEMIDTNQYIPQNIINKLAASVCKTHIRLLFSAIMSDTALYNCNIDKMYEAILVKYPEKKTMVGKLYEIARRRAMADINSLRNLVDAATQDGTFSSLIDQIEGKNMQLEDATRK